MGVGGRKSVSTNRCFRSSFVESSSNSEPKRTERYQESENRFVAAVKDNDIKELKKDLICYRSELSQDILNDALHFASCNGYGEILSLLCTSNLKKADINSKDKGGRTAVYIAARMGRVECLRILLELGADLNLPTDLKHANLAGETRDWAPSSKFTYTVNFDERGGMTPLHAAARVNSPDCAQLILENKKILVNVHSKDELGMEPILHAGSWVRAGDEKETRKYEIVLDLLLKYGANAKANYADDSDGIPVSMSALRTAAGLGSTTAVKMLLQRGADPKWGKGCGNGRTALHESAKGGFSEVLKLLLSNIKENKIEDRERAKKEDNQQLIPENKAVHKNAEDVIKKGEDQDREWLNHRDYAGNTALHYTAFSGSKSCVTLLLKNGANLQTKNEAGLTAYKAIIKRVPNGKRFIKELLENNVISNSSIPNRSQTLKAVSLVRKLMKELQKSCFP